MRAYEFILEAVENVLKDWKGWWITDEGERIDVDPENDHHHYQAAEEYFQDYADVDEFYDDDGIITEWGIDEFIEIAKDQGWIRVYDRPDEFGIEFNQLNPKTKRIILRELGQNRDKFKIYINNKIFDNIGEAQRYVRNLN